MMSFTNKMNFYIPWCRHYLFAWINHFVIIFLRNLENLQRGGAILQPKSGEDDEEKISLTYNFKYLVNVPKQATT